MPAPLSSQSACPDPDPLASLEHTFRPNFFPSDAGLGLGMEQPKALHLGSGGPLGDGGERTTLWWLWGVSGGRVSAMNTSFPEASAPGPRSEPLCLSLLSGAVKNSASQVVTNH